MAIYMNGKRAVWVKEKQDRSCRGGMRGHFVVYSFANIDKSLLGKTGSKKGVISAGVNDLMLITSTAPAKSFLNHSGLSANSGMAFISRITIFYPEFIIFHHKSGSA
jgi:hypothetical protein